MDINELNSRFAVPNHVSIVAGRGGLATVKIANQAATAEIALMGGHILSFIPKDGQEVIWVSKASRYEVGVPIRGGVPICWPWFGKHPEGGDYPMHGFARQMLWDIDSVQAPAADCTVVTLKLASNAETKKLWGFDFVLKLSVAISKTLTLTLATENTGKAPFTISQGIHTYFKISHVDNVTIKGFDGKSYFDKVGGANDIKLNQGDIKINREIDGVFKHAPGPFQILDPQAKRTIEVTTEGSDSAVVWNPWIERSKALADYTPDAYETMVCVETCNALEDARTIQPGQTHALKAVYTIR